jgi:hypothetical protein
MPKSKLRGGAKAHRTKIAKRNKLISQEKSGMQKAFDRLMEEQIQKLKNGEGLSIESSGNTIPFEVFDKEHLDSIVDFKGRHPELLMGNDEDVMNTEEEQK